MSKTIAIAGLGWLGKPLAQRLKFLGYSVKGSVTTLEKAAVFQKSGIDAYSVIITEDGTQGSVQAFLKNVDDLIVMIPPGLRRNTGADYVLKMTHFISEIEQSDVKNCIFISSTSVYGDDQGKVSEKDIPQPETEAGRQLFQVEQLFFNASFQTSIVRFGGLFGGSRQPARYLAGRENLSGGNAPVNLIHRNDCIAIIIEIIKQQAYKHIFNAVHPDHPKKAVYYQQKALDLQLTPPNYSDQEEEPHKEVNSSHLRTILNYSFKNDLSAS